MKRFLSTITTHIDMLQPSNQNKPGSSTIILLVRSQLFCPITIRYHICCHGNTNIFASSLSSTLFHIKGGEEDQEGRRMKAKENRRQQEQYEIDKDEEKK